MLFDLFADCRLQMSPLSPLCEAACTSPAFCSLIAYSWLDLAVCATQRPVVSKEHNESTRSKSQISPEWAERHKFSPSDCCPRHVLPIEHMNNEHSHQRPLCQGQGPLSGMLRHHSLCETMKMFLQHNILSCFEAQMNGFLIDVETRRRGINQGSDWWRELLTCGAVIKSCHGLIHHAYV